MKSLTVRSAICLLTASAMLMALTACSSGKSGERYEGLPVAETRAAAAAPTAYAKNAGADFEADMAGYDAAEMASGGSFSQIAETPAPQIEEGGNIQPSRKLIRTVDLGFQTKEYDSFLSGIKERISRYEGWVEYSDESGNDYYGNRGRTAFINARIPNDRLDAFLNEGFEGAAITQRSEHCEDVTLQYSDIEAHILTLRTEQDRMLELLASADSIESIIALEGKLSEIKYELESLTRNLKYYDNQVSYSTVTMSINEVRNVEPARRAGFAERVSEGLKNSMSGLGETIVDLSVFLIVSLPSIIFFGALIFVIVKAVRAVKRRRNRKKTEKAEKAGKKAASAAAADNNGSQDLGE